MDWMSSLDAAFRIAAAFVLGSIIGYEREVKGRAAGLRTHVLVCIGSAASMLISLHLQQTYASGPALDPSRIAAGVLTGIGFLGAGTIIKTQERAMGLTTAATIWVSAIIGLAVGSGYYLGGVLASVLALAALRGLKVFE